MSRYRSPDEINANRVRSGIRDQLVCAVTALSATMAGCAHHRAEARHLPAWVFQASQVERGDRNRSTRVVRVRPRGGISGRNEASDFVVSALQGAGFRFGTDGSIPALWGYLRTSHVVVSPSDTRHGDVLFFRRSPTSGPSSRGCDTPDHAGIVSAVDGDGRIVFVEARDGRIDQSYVDPQRPQLRRDPAGRIHNTFLREKRIDDPPDTPNFAGEMLCAAARPRS